MLTNFRMRTRLTLAAIFTGAVLLVTALDSLAEKPANILRKFSTSIAVIETSRNICIPLTIFLADTPQQHSRGLMFVERLEDDEGMLFRYSGPANITMWMKNTYISLDMLFIRGDGTIVNIAARTEPMSTRRIHSQGPVAGVLEVNAGYAEQWSIKPGNQLLTVN